MNLGQALCGLALVAGLVAAIGWWGPWRGERLARAAFRAQWLALAGAAAFLWTLLARHDFRYVYVATYSARDLPGHLVFAAFWGGQGGTFLLWALLTATLGLLLLRQRHPLAAAAAAFLNLPLLLLGLACVLRGPFTTFAPGAVPADGRGLNPLLQDFWMMIHPPVLFLGYAALTVPFALALVAAVRRDWDGWVRPALPWAALAAATLAAGIVMGGIWAYAVLGWGGYWSWDPVENGSLVPWLIVVALLHGLLVQRGEGGLRRTNLALAVGGYALVAYASYLTRSGVLADFSVHSFADEGLGGLLLAFLLAVLVVGGGPLVARWRSVPAPARGATEGPRETALLLGLLLLVVLAALVTVGMSAPLLQRALGRPGGVQPSYYDGVSGPAAVLLGLLLGLAPLVRRGRPGLRELLRAALPALAVAVLATLAIVLAGLHRVLPATILFAAVFALAANAPPLWRGLRSGWRHDPAVLGHVGVALLLVGVVVSSGFGRSAGVVLPPDEERGVLDWRLTYEGLRPGPDGHDRAHVRVSGPGGTYVATPVIAWSEEERGYRRSPDIRRLLGGDLYLSPIELLGTSRPADGPVWLAVGESWKGGGVTYTLLGLEPEAGEMMRIVARVGIEANGRHEVLRPALEIDMRSHEQHRRPDCLPDGGELSLVAADPITGRVALELPAGESAGAGGLAVELSTHPGIGLVWLGAILAITGLLLAGLQRGGRGADPERAEPQPGA
jgi:cytochrome c-type biogenesis protein CcmF